MWRQASLMINETAPNQLLAGGAVQFQANQAVEDLGALAYVSSGELSYCCAEVLEENVEASRWVVRGTAHVVAAADGSYRMLSRPGRVQA